MKFKLIPLISVGPFIIGEDIEKYIVNYDFQEYKFENLFEGDVPDSYKDDWETYKNMNLGITLILDEKRKIESIECEKEIYYKEVNLIGLNLTEVCEILGDEPISIEKQEMVDEIYENWDFDSLGLYILSFQNVIKAVSCFSKD